MLSTGTIETQRRRSATAGSHSFIEQPTGASFGERERDAAASANGKEWDDQAGESYAGPEAQEIRGHFCGSSARQTEDIIV